MLAGLSTAEGVGRHGFSVELKARGALNVGAVGADFGGFEFGENFRTRMPIAVVESAGDDRPLRRDARQKLRPRGCDAAMMADFEQRALQAGFAPAWPVRLGLRRRLRAEPKSLRRPHAGQASRCCQAPRRVDSRGRARGRGRLHRRGTARRRRGECGREMPSWPASLSSASYDATGGLLPTHNCVGWKLRRTAGKPPM